MSESTITDTELAHQAKFIVSTSDLRRLLKSTVPHAYGKANIPAMYRVRFHLQGARLRVLATCGYTAALAATSVGNEYGDDEATFDVTPADVKKILEIFDGKGDGADYQQLTVVAGGKYLTVTDTSMLIPGESLQLNRYPTAEKYPDLEAMIRLHIGYARADQERLVTDSEFLRNFTTSAGIIKAPLVIRPSGALGTLLINCGGDFVGLLMPWVQHEQDEANQTAWMDRWLNDLPEDPAAPSSVDWGLYGQQVIDLSDEGGEIAEPGEIPNSAVGEPEDLLDPDAHQYEQVKQATTPVPDPFTPAGDFEQERQPHPEDASDAVPPLSVPEVETENLVSALDLCITFGKGAATVLRDNMGGSHKAAAARLDRLTELGYLGPYRGPNPREVLVSVEDSNEAMATLRAGRPWRVSE